MSIVYDLSDRREECEYRIDALLAIITSLDDTCLLRWWRPVRRTVVPPPFLRPEESPQFAERLRFSS